MLNSVAFLSGLWKSHRKAIKISFSQVRIAFGIPGSIPFFILMGHSIVLNFFHNFKLIRPCVQNYFFTPEIDVDKWLKNNEIWCVFMAFFKALKKATELAKSNFTNM